MHPVDIKSAAAEQPQPPLPDVADRHWAWFLDVDGTLLELEKDPALVTADRSLLRLLKRLNKACDGALALISGRSLEQLQRIFDPLTLAAGASHGLELRLPDGSIRHSPQAIPAPIAEKVAAFVNRHEGLILERKPHTLCVHYRKRPELEEEVLARLQQIHAEMDDGFRLLHGKMMIELTPTAAHKGSAIDTFMALPPFAGRKPVFVGDDVTDEDGFRAVNRQGGVSVRIGAGASAADWRFANTTELREWLHGALYLL